MVPTESGPDKVSHDGGGTAGGGFTGGVQEGVKEGFLDGYNSILLNCDYEHF